VGRRLDQIRRPSYGRQTPFDLTPHLILLGITGLLANAHHTVRTGPSAVVAVVASFILLALGAALSRRVARIGCRFEPQGLRVRNVFSERVVEWSRIEAFVALEGWTPMMRARLLDGSTIPISGVRGMPFDEHMKAIGHRLNAELTRHTGRQIDPAEVDAPRPPASRGMSPLFHHPIAILLAFVAAVFITPFSLAVVYDAVFPIGTVAALVAIVVAPILGIQRVYKRGTPVVWVLALGVASVALSTLFIGITLANANEQIGTAIIVVVAILGVLIARSIRSPRAQTVS
jgi:hypothetical protein